ncbi:uncharacterized protein BO95DRAFT_486701 [Aspergillus brunneoviolaceus CBS 621.78]|uniref:Uncharacterized protein n=1 Tax=Aspergillus brunneoviolaceus CBS 621.78 TaxID=1450534 RepID=A0ACD1FS25_9EURO|nr:hypothetical protein BO95DRAFT_486701 [Aspergillus brunneoviolaceus CBS 621.78]RAH39785.1 hypothetical protein BO95DRAFT_486701 [Aspergillus brunneoviolaceus CBS 621.78]
MQDLPRCQIGEVTSADHQELIMSLLVRLNKKIIEVNHSRAPSTGTVLRPTSFPSARWAHNAPTGTVLTPVLVGCSAASIDIAHHLTPVECDLETLYTYSAQCWLWNETQQLQRRYRAFDLPALIYVAEQAGRQQCREVATMRYARENLHLPVPQVLAYCSRAGDSQLDAEYIVMEKARGIELSRVWETLKPREKLSIVQQLGSITSRLSSGRFPAHGSLYLREDVAESEALAGDDVFAIGPTTGRAWFDDQRAAVDIHRGPWPSTKDTIHALIQREQAYIHQLPSFPRDHQQGIFNGPSGYYPAKQTKLSVLQDFLSIYHHLLPKDEALNQGILWHNDLHLDNIEYDGPKPERFVRPRLPEGIDALNPAREEGGRGDVPRVYKEAPDLLHAFRYRETVQSDLLGLYTERDLVRQAEEYARWEGDVERKARVIEELGVYPGWNGAVPPGDYDEMARRLEVAKKRFLDRGSRTPEERRVWEKAWPFEDKVE